MYVQKLIAFVAVFMFVFSSFAAELAEKDADNDGKLSIEEFAGDACVYVYEFSFGSLER